MFIFLNPAVHVVTPGDSLSLFIFIPWLYYAAGHLFASYAQLTLNIKALFTFHQIFTTFNFIN